MALLNCTTSIVATKSIYEIIRILTLNKAKAIMQEFDAKGDVTALSFKCDTQFGEVAFRLPLDIRAVQAVMKGQRLQYRFLTEDHARRVGWRILKDWTEAQMALVQIGMAKIRTGVLAIRPEQRREDCLRVFS